MIIMDFSPADNGMVRLVGRTIVQYGDGDRTGKKSHPGKLGCLSTARTSDDLRLLSAMGRESTIVELGCVKRRDAIES